MIKWILAMLLGVGLVLAASPNILLLDLFYNQGDIQLVRYEQLTGYAPDRKIKPQNGYQLEIVGTGKVLHSFSFNPPNTFYTEGSDENGELSGGLVSVDSIRFALVVPYFEDMKEIRIYSDQGIKISTIPMQETKTNYWPWVIGGIILIIILFVIIRKHHR